MVNFKFILVLFSILNGLCFAVVQKPFYFTLENGMKVYIAQDHSLPLVAHSLLYKVGAAEDPKGRSGMAHYLEHLMFRSTDKVESISKELQSTFAKFNAGTSSYYTVYHALVAKDKLKDVMKIEADRMSHLKIAEVSANLERKIVLEERKMRIDNSPVSLLEEEMLAAFYRNDRSWQVAGWESEILELNKYDAASMHDKFYNPNNAILVIVGDVDFDNTKSEIIKHYGNLKNKADNAKHIILKEPKHLSDIQIRMKNKINNLNMVSYIFSAPNIKNEDQISAFISFYILANSKFSKIRNELVNNLQIAFSVDSHYHYLTNSQGILQISITPATNVGLDVIEQNFNRIAEDILKNGVTIEDLNIAKTELKFDLSKSLNSVESRSIIYAVLLANGVDLSYFDALSSKIDSITLEQINLALHNLLNSKKVVGFLC